MPFPDMVGVADSLAQAGRDAVWRLFNLDNRVVDPTFRAELDPSMPLGLWGLYSPLHNRIILNPAGPDRNRTLRHEKLHAGLRASGRPKVAFSPEELPPRERAELAYYDPSEFSEEVPAFAAGAELLGPLLKLSEQARLLERAGPLASAPASSALEGFFPEKVLRELLLRPQTPVSRPAAERLMPGSPLEGLLGRKIVGR